MSTTLFHLGKDDGTNERTPYDIEEDARPTGYMHIELTSFSKYGPYTTRQCIKDRNGNVLWSDDVKQHGP